MTKTVARKEIGKVTKIRRKEGRVCWRPKVMVDVTQPNDGKC